jgi:8-oxo-dGTP pyrophosphatase MutT (NUDIX family)/transcriptional regulator with XRE-family HTH domain
VAVEVDHDQAGRPAGDADVVPRRRPEPRHAAGVAQARPSQSSGTAGSLPPGRHGNTAQPRLAAATAAFSVLHAATASLAAGCGIGCPVRRSPPIRQPPAILRPAARCRRLRGWTQADLASALAGAGVDLGESAVVRMERGIRGVSLDEAIAIATVLGVSPLHMIVPVDDNGAQLAPQITVATTDARAWIRGQRPLTETDEQLYYAQAPASEAEWLAIAPGAWRFKSKEDYEATKAKWERDIYRAAIGGRTSQEPGPDAEDIPVRRPAAQPAVVAVVVTSPLGVLVGRRRDGSPPWTFIAGEQEPGERPEGTAVREVKEETGLRVRAGEVIGERVHPKSGRHLVYMAAAPTHGLDTIVGDEEELAEVRWVSLAEADQLMGGMIYEPVHEYLTRELGRQAESDAHDDDGTGPGRPGAASGPASE